MWRLLTLSVVKVLSESQCVSDLFPSLDLTGLLKSLTQPFSICYRRVRSTRKIGIGLTFPLTLNFRRTHGDYSFVLDTPILDKNGGILSIPQSDLGDYSRYFHNIISTLVMEYVLVHPLGVRPPFFGVFINTTTFLVIAKRIF